MYRITRSYLSKAVNTSIRVQKMSLDQRLAARATALNRPEIITFTPLARAKLVETLVQEYNKCLSIAATKKIEEVKSIESPDDELILPHKILSKNEIQKIKDDHQFLKLSIKTKGCNGQAYDLVAVPESKIERRDIKLNIAEIDGNEKLSGFLHPSQKNLSLVIAHRAEMFVIGSVMDYEDSRLSSGFIFENPQVEGACGCGESFNFDVDMTLNGNK